MHPSHALGKVERQCFHFARPHIHSRKVEFCDILLHMHLGMVGSFIEEIEFLRLESNDVLMHP